MYPTAPRVRKEMKTTIYPNGTTVEEVTEIVDGKGKMHTTNSCCEIAVSFYLLHKSKSQIPVFICRWISCSYKNNQGDSRRRYK